MAPKSTPWFRLYSEVLTDRKILRIRSMAGLPKCIVIGAWTTLLIMANDSPERGRLLISADAPIFLDEIIGEWELDNKAGQALMDTFIALGLVYLDGQTYGITQWDVRQFTSDIDGAERVRRSRGRKRQDECNNDVTLQNEGCNNDVTPPESDTESYTDTDNTLPIGNGASAPPPEIKKSGPKPKRQKATEPKAEKVPPPPAVVVYRNIANRYPDAATWEGIAQAVGNVPKDLEFWGDVVRGYIGCGWNKLNVNGMIEFYKRRELPAVKRGSQNGQYRQSSHSIEGTGEELDRLPTVDIYTGRTVPPRVS